MKIISTILFFTIATALGAQLAPAPAGVPAPVRQYPVERIQFAYARENARLPKLSALAGAFAGAVSRGGPGLPKLAVTASPDGGLALPTGAVLDESALRAIEGVVVKRFNDLGISGVLVMPDGDQINSDGIDLRGSDRSLTLKIWATEIVQVRTVAKGDRIRDGETLDNPAHSRILANSPLRAEAAGPADLLDLGTLDDYLRRLNRQPGRTVEASISNASATDANGKITTEVGRAVLDYLVNESKPWYVYAQVSNTGTDATGLLRERVGVVDNQLFGKDDILTLDYLTNDFKRANAAFGSYDIPLWFPDRLRLKLYGSWGDFDATAPFLVGQTDSDFTGSTTVGGGNLTASLFAIGGVAVDLEAGVESDHIESNDLSLNTEGTATLLIPHVALRASGATPVYKLDASFGYETNENHFDATSLGRLDTKDTYQMLLGSMSFSTFLEPLFYGVAPGSNSWQHSTMANEIAISANGQYVLDGDRLIPQKQAALGGFFSERGYPESVVSGDDVYQATVEYRFHVPRALEPASELAGPGRPAPSSSLFGQPFNLRPPRIYGQPDWDLILRAFVDGGVTRINQPEATESSHTLLDAGLGAEVQVRSNFTLRFDWGLALHALRTGLTTGGVYVPGVNDVAYGHSEFHILATFVW